MKAGDIHVSIKKIPPGDGHPMHGKMMGCPVDGFQCPGFNIVEKAFPNGFGFTNDNAVRMIQRLFREGGDMDSAHHHGNPLFSESISDLIGTGDFSRKGRDANKVDGLSKINTGYSGIQDLNVPVRWS
jgi:hypothetical protein